MQRPVDRLAAHLFTVVDETIDEPLLLRALTHRSYAYEHGGLPNNERLEFLGDSVLGLVVTDSLYAAHPDLPEGQLAKLRAAVVNMRALAEVARTMGLGQYIFLGRGEESTGGRDKASILADTMEAVIAAVYLSGGLTAATTLPDGPRTGAETDATPASRSATLCAQPRRRTPASTVAVKRACRRPRCMRSGSSQASRIWAAEPAVIGSTDPTGTVSRRPERRSVAATQMRSSPCRR